MPLIQKDSNIMISRTITIFLASSDELINDRDSIDLFIHKLNDIYVPRGIHVECKRWEDFIAYCTGTRTQDDYNKVVAQSDICLCLFHRKAGKYTIEEFNYAMDEYKRTGDHPKTYVYARTIVDGEIEEEDLKKFKKDLFEQLGHYWCNYATSDSMKLHFVMQFERLLNGEYLSGHESNLKVERGNVLLHGKKIADFANLPFASENTEMKTLKEKIVALDKEIAEFRALNVEALRPTINAKLNERNECQKQLEQLETQLLDITMSISKMISSGNPISERKRLAIEMFEKGNNKGVLEVLNEADIASDHERAKAELVSGKQLVSAGEEIIAAAEQKIRSLVEELTLKAQTWMTTYTEPNRFEEACKCYELAISMTRESLQEDFAKQNFCYAKFLQENNQFDAVENFALEALNIYENHADNYQSEINSLRNILYVTYVNTQHFEQAEKCILLNIEVYKKKRNLLEKRNYILALSYLGELYTMTRKYEKAMNVYDELHLFCTKYAQNNEDEEDVVGMIYARYGCFCCLMQRPSDAVNWYAKSIDIFRRLYVKDEGFAEQLGEVLGGYVTSLMLLDKNVQGYIEFQQEALNLYEELADKYPHKYTPKLLMLYNNRCRTLLMEGKFDSAEKEYLNVLSKYQRLSIDNPKTYQVNIAIILQSLSFLYSENKQYDKAQIYLNEAMQISRKLAIAYPKIYAPVLVQTLLHKAYAIISDNRIITQQDKDLNIYIESVEEAESLCREMYLKNDVDILQMLVQVLEAKIVYYGYLKRDLKILENLVDEVLSIYNYLERTNNFIPKQALLKLLIDVADELEQTGNMSKAIKWYRKAADNGAIEAQYILDSRVVEAVKTTPNIIDIARYIVSTQECSISRLQCEFEMGYHCICNFLEQLEEYGVVGPNEGSKCRVVLMRNMDELEHLDKIMHQSPKTSPSFWERLKNCFKH